MAARTRGSPIGAPGKLCVVQPRIHRGLATGTPRDERGGRLSPVSQDDLERRVESLETTVGDIDRRLRVTEQDAAAARVLAGAADRDVSEIRAEIRDFRQATTTSFNALRQDFVDLRQDFVDFRTHVDRRFEQVDQGFAEMDRGFMEMRGKFDATAAGQQRIVELIESLINQQDR